MRSRLFPAFVCVCSLSYSFYAVPINGLGAGSSTNTVRVRTNGSVPGVAEVAAFARTIAQTPVNQLRWLRPAANGILSTYTVRSLYN